MPSEITLIYMDSFYLKSSTSRESITHSPISEMRPLLAIALAAALLFASLMSAAHWHDLESETGHPEICSICQLTSDTTAVPACNGNRLAQSLVDQPAVLITAHYFPAEYRSSLPRAPPHLTV
ncbi:MAG: hypothetical protein ACWA5K_07665 [bacterium]